MGTGHCRLTSCMPESAIQVAKNPLKLPFFSSTSPSQNRYAHWMNKLHISDDARQDLVEIKQYIAEDLDSPNAAAQTVKGILKGITRLKEQSGIGAPLSSIVPVESEYRFLV